MRVRVRMSERRRPARRRPGRWRCARRECVRVQILGVWRADAGSFGSGKGDSGSHASSCEVWRLVGSWAEQRREPQRSSKVL